VISEEGRLYSRRVAVSPAEVRVEFELILLTLEPVISAPGRSIMALRICTHIGVMIVLLFLLGRVAAQTFPGCYTD
jgi:hypothetical protein